MGDFPVYEPKAVTEAFAEIVAGKPPFVAAGDFLDDFRRATIEDRRRLVRDPLPTVPPKNQTLVRWAAFFAALVDQLCWESGIPAPGWVDNREYILSCPWFLIPASALRAWVLTTSPVPFKMRNIFCGDNVLSRV